MTDPHAPQPGAPDSAPDPAVPPTPDASAVSAPEPERVDSFAAEPEPQLPFEQDHDLGPRAAGPDGPPAGEVVEPGVPLDAPEPAQPASLADEEPVEPAPEEPVVEQPVVEQPVVEQPVVEQPVVEQPVGEQPVGEQPVGQEAVAEGPDAEQATATPEPAELGQAPAGPEEADPEQAPVELEPGDDEPAASAPPGTSRRGTPAWVPVVALAAVAALLAGGTAYAGYELHQQTQERDAARRAEQRTEADLHVLRRTEQKADEAVQAAREAATALFSYSYKSLERDFEKGLSFTTGSFREEYERTTSEVVSPVAERYDAVVQAEVSDVGVVSVEPRKVTVLVFLNQVTTSTRVTDQQVDRSRVRMRMVERDGTWLVEGVDAL